MMSTMCTCGDMQQMAESGYNLFVPHVNRKTGESCPGFKLGWAIPTFSFGPREVNMKNYPQEWFVEMANRIKARDHATQMVVRWQKKVDEAEAAITELSEGTTMQPETIHDPEPVQE